MLIKQYFDAIFLGFSKLRISAAECFEKRERNSSIIA